MSGPARDAFRPDRRDFLRGAAAAGLWAAAGSLPGWAAGPEKRPAAASLRCASYDPAEVRGAVRGLFDLIGGIADRLPRGARVAVKPNLTGAVRYNDRFAVPAVESYWTHPAVVEAVCECLADCGASKISIVEAVVSFDAYTKWGYDAVARRFSADLVDLNAPDPHADFVTVPVRDPRVFGTVRLHPLLVEVDAFVSVAKMKCHGCLGVTHGIKNLVGILPVRFHRENPSQDNRPVIHANGNLNLPGITLDLLRARPISLSVIDGVATTEAGEGPWNGTMAPIRPRVLIAGKDPVAADALATALQGFDPMAADFTVPFRNSVNYLRAAQAQGFGLADLSAVEVKGLDPREAAVPFKACA